MSFLLLLIATLVTAIIVAALVITAFQKPVQMIFNKILGDELATAYRKFITFALFVVGVSSGVQVWKLERYLEPLVTSPDPEKAEAVITLTTERWGYEIYSAVIGTLGGLAWALLIFFVIALILVAVTRRRETKTS